MTPFRIYCGWDKRQAEAAEVFAHSVREHASIAVEVVFVAADQHEAKSRSAGSSEWGCEVGHWDRVGVTAFSYVRFLVPWMCDYQGVAVFCDGCDMLCLGDVAELAAMPMDGLAVRVAKHERGGEDRPRSRTSMMLMDCSAPELRAWTPEVVEHAPDDRLMRLRDLADDRIGDLPWEWNALTQPGSEPPDGAKIAHWSALAIPDGGSWIDRSGSRTWAAARERWRATR